MAQFPPYPKLGQSFLSGSQLYVWSGYQWNLYSSPTTVTRAIVSATRSDSNPFYFNSVTSSGDDSSSLGFSTAFLITSSSFSRIIFSLRQSSTSVNSCQIEIYKNPNGSSFTSASSLASITQTILKADTIYQWTFSSLSISQFDSIHIKLSPSIGGSNQYYGILAVD